MQWFNAVIFYHAIANIIGSDCVIIIGDVAIQFWLGTHFDIPLLELLIFYDKDFEEIAKTIVSSVEGSSFEKDEFTRCGVVVCHVQIRKRPRLSLLHTLSQSYSEPFVIKTMQAVTENNKKTQIAFVVLSLDGLIYILRQLCKKHKTNNLVRFNNLQQLLLLEAKKKQLSFQNRKLREVDVVQWLANVVE